MKIKFLLFGFFLYSSVLFAQSSQNSLHGAWRFGLDPINVGVHQGWTKPEFNTQTWDKVTVPHSYSVDPRYYNYTGTAWYFKRFAQVAVPKGYRAFIRFEAVFYKAQVWLNGKLTGAHEGGYTPFEIDVTEALANENALAIRVNNAWDTTTIPGAKTKVTYQGANMSQFFPWMNYGGITREVKLILRHEAYINSVRIVATPDLVKKTAHLHIVALVSNKAGLALKKNNFQAFIYQSGKKVPAKFRVAIGEATADNEIRLSFEATMAAKDVKLWNIDDPNLYQSELIAGLDTVRTRFGIRKIEIRGTKLLLNGEPISLGGCNRPLDYPGHGSMDPPEVLNKDLTLIKSAGMELSRISHYPVSTQLLDWADEHGMLIIAEAGNWQMTPKQMEDPLMRAKFQSQMKEMMERDWNHPSVIAWSLGNEYQSQMEEGKSWTKDMYTFTKAIDPSRLITFSTKMLSGDNIKKREDEASQYVDFISANIYGNHLNTLQRIHKLYPDKPVYISEFGVRADLVKEKDRITYLKKAMEAFRQCDFLVGASVWSFNDYQSYFPGSNANGYRPFGLVTPDRQPREMYFAWQEEFSPATITVQESAPDKIKILLTARKGFPSYTLRNYKLRVSGQSFAIAVLKPGESKTFTIDLNQNKSGDKTIELVKPGDFVILKKNY